MGEDINPDLLIGNVPNETVSLVLIMDDPDAVEVVGYTWVHWLVWNIFPDTTVIRENTVPENAIQGVGSLGSASYQGPCPPEGRTHLYFFKLYALDINLTIPSTNVQSLLQAIDGHVIDQAILTGLYSKSGPPTTANTASSSTDLSKFSTSTSSTTTLNQTTGDPGLFTTLISIFAFFLWLRRKKNK